MATVNKAKMIFQCGLLYCIYKNMDIDAGNSCKCWLLKAAGSMKLQISAIVKH